VTLRINPNLTTKIDPSKTVSLYPCFAPNGWSYYVDITVDHTQLSDTLTNFPLCIQGSVLPSGFWSHVKADGGDIVPVLVNNHRLLRRECAYISTGDEKLELHIRVPVLSDSKDTVIRLYYGNANASWPDSPYVWDANFKAVYHMDDDPDTSHITDSTANENDGTKKGANEPAEVAGQVAVAQDFDGEDDYIDCGNAVSLRPTEITIETIISADKPTGGVGYDRVITRSDASATSSSNSYSLQFFGTSGKLAFQIWVEGDDSAKAITQDTAVDSGDYIVGRYDKTDLRIYRNGSLDCTPIAQTGDIRAGAQNLLLGACTGLQEITMYNGRLDEVRLSSIARSPEWIEATYKTLLTPSTLYGAGSEQSV